LFKKGKNAVGRLIIFCLFGVSLGVILVCVLFASALFHVVVFCVALDPQLSFLFWTRFVNLTSPFEWALKNFTIGPAGLSGRALREVEGWFSLF